VFPEAPVLWVDAGNFSALGIPGAGVRNEGMIEAFNRIGYAAVMLGERELAQGYETFIELGEAAEFPFVSANIVFEGSQEPLVEPYVIVPVRHRNREIRVALTGLNRYNTSFLKSTRDGRNIVVSSPFETARRLVPELRKQADVVIILTALSISQSRQLALEVPGIDLIIGANGGVLSQPHERAGDVPIVYTGNQGKYLSEIRLTLDGAEGKSSVSQPRHHYLNRDYPDDPDIKFLVFDILARENEIHRERASAEIPELNLPPGMPSYAGAGACLPCHGEIHASWKTTRHARAFESLVQEKQDFNRDCVACHTMGFGRKGGFVNAKATPEFIDVQCEACHGPASGHIEDSTRPYGTAGARSCLGCHDAENSPEFNYYSYWPRIQH
jgi:hypothetical protein